LIRMKRLLRCGAFATMVFTHIPFALGDCTANDECTGSFCGSVFKQSCPDQDSAALCCGSTCSSCSSEVCCADACCWDAGGTSAVGIVVGVLAGCCMCIGCAAIGCVIYRHQLARKANPQPGASTFNPYGQPTVTYGQPTAVVRQPQVVQATLVQQPRSVQVFAQDCSACHAQSCP
jgi:hypothetical protein